MSSRFELFDQPKVVTTVSTPNGASELYLIDHTFAEVGRGVGQLELPVVPGTYRVRERVGDIESVSDKFEVVSDKPINVELRGVAYDSPFPIAGTATYQHLQGLEGRARHESGVRIVVRDTQAGSGDSGTGNVSLMEEVGRLRVETLAGDTVILLSDAVDTAVADGVFAIDIHLDPGMYTLVQDGLDERQSCVALHILPDWYPAVYLLLPRQPNPESGRRRLRLADMSLFYVASDAPAQPTDTELARLEAARHALSRGRAIGGWAMLPDAQGNPVFNPLMALIDAYLLLPGDPGADGDPVSVLIAGAASALGASFPDVQAVRMARSKALFDATSRATIEDVAASAQTQLSPALLGPLAGPPILSRSWRHLLDAGNARDRLRAALPFEFAIEPSETWFIWSEEIGARSTAHDVAVSTSFVDSVSSGKLLVLSKQIFETIALSAQGRDWVRLVEDVASKRMADGERLFSDPTMQRIIAALDMVSDPILQKSFSHNPTELVARAWATLQVPDDVLRSTLRRFAAFLVKNELLAGLGRIAGLTSLKNLLGWLRRVDAAREHR